MRLLCGALLVCLLFATDTKTPTISDADTLRVKDAQLAVERAVNALLQSPQYLALQAAQVGAAGVVADIEKKAGCKLDPQTIECVPPAKPPEKAPEKAPEKK